MHHWGTAPGVKQPEGVSLLSMPLWDAVKSNLHRQGGATGEVKMPKAWLGSGMFNIFHFAFNKPYKMAALARLADSHEQEQAEAATEHLSLHVKSLW